MQGRLVFRLLSRCRAVGTELGNRDRIAGDVEIRGGGGPVVVLIFACIRLARANAKIRVGGNKLEAQAIVVRQVQALRVEARVAERRQHVTHLRALDGLCAPLIRVQRQPPASR